MATIKASPLRLNIDLTANTSNTICSTSAVAYTFSILHTPLLQLDNHSKIFHSKPLSKKKKQSLSVYMYIRFTSTSVIKQNVTHEEYSASKTKSTVLIWFTTSSRMYCQGFYPSVFTEIKYKLTLQFEACKKQKHKTLRLKTHFDGLAQNYCNYI